jgi:hypothetical protein
MNYKMIGTPKGIFLVVVIASLVVLLGVSTLDIGGVNDICRIVSNIGSQ